MKKVLSILIFVLVFLSFTGCDKKDTDDNKSSIKVQSNERSENLNQLEVLNEYINIREKASVESNLIGKVLEGEIYTIYSIIDDESYKWFEIRTNNNIHGYIANPIRKDYIKLFNEDLWSSSYDEVSSDTQSKQ